MTAVDSNFISPVNPASLIFFKYDAFCGTVLYDDNIAGVVHRYGTDLLIKHSCLLNYNYWFLIVINNFSFSD